VSKRATKKPTKSRLKPSRTTTKAKSKPKAAARPKAAAKPKTKAKAAVKAKAPVRSKAKAAKKAPPKAPSKAPPKAPAAKLKTRAAGKARDKKRTVRAAESAIVLLPDYRPSENEPFMNEHHRVYFRQKLLTWKEEIIRQTRETLEGLHEDSTQHADLADRATSETDRALELRARDRQRKLINKIDAALARIEDGSYGYCEDTGEPIGLKRLDARPIATLSVEAQERHERRERVYRED
jgi:RNA polymerase-binding transcription factor